MAEEMNTAAEEACDSDCETFEDGADYEEADYASLKEKNGRMEALLEASREYAVAGQLKSWLSEAEELKKEQPGFDLGEEMKNELFRAGLRLGMDMRSLYCGMHFDEAAGLIAKRAAATAVQGARKSLGRPGEVGIKGPRAVKSVTDVSALSDEEMEQIVKRIAKGDKISFS